MKRGVAFSVGIGGFAAVVAGYAGDGMGTEIQPGMMLTPGDAMNPRHLRERDQQWIGKKVLVGLTTFHHVCGTWKNIEGYDAVFAIGTRKLRVKLAEIDTVSEAPAGQAEFYQTSLIGGVS